MKILILFDSFSLGGAEFHAFKLAKYFREQLNYQVEVCVFEEGDGTLKRLCMEHDIKTNIIGYFPGLGRYLFPLQFVRYGRLFRKLEPDVILSFNNKPNFLNGLIWKQSGAKCGIWSQQNVGEYKIEKWIERKALKNISCFISNSFHGGQYLIKNYHVDKEKIYVVQNGIEEARPVVSTGDWRNKLGITGKEFVGIMAANLTGTKDHITLLKAWKIVTDKLKADNRTAILLLPGRFGSTADTIYKTIYETDIFPNVKILGMISDMPGLYRVADIGILSSNAEGLPNTVLEAMEAGLPVVGTNIEGIKECVGEDGYPFLNDPFDFEKMAENILLFAGDTIVTKNVGILNRERVKKQFSYEKMCQETLAIISKYLE